MAQFEFKCPLCGQSIKADDAYRGQVAECPHCEKGIVIPRSKPKLGIRRNVGVSQSFTQTHLTGGYDGEHIAIPRRFQQTPELAQQEQVCHGQTSKSKQQSRVNAQIPPKRRYGVMRKVVSILCAILCIAFVASVASYCGYRYFGDLPRLDRGITCYKSKAYAKAINLLLPLAKKGYAKAQLYVGDCYANGNGVFIDTEESVKWYRAAADQELPVAQYRMFKCCSDGIGIEQNQKNAAKWCRKAADAGLVEAMFDMGLLYVNGIGVEVNAKSAFKWFRKGAERDYPPALYQLGACYKFGYGVEKDEDEASKWQNKAVTQWRTNAKAGDITAMIRLANLYKNGDVVELDKEEAVNWYRKAAELGDATAQLQLALCYRKGEGVEEDNEEAAKWMLKSAEQGKDRESQWAMGIFYRDGIGVENDVTEAVKWFERSAKRGFLPAKYALAMCYLQGEGTRQDTEKGEALLEEAANEGDKIAKKELGRIRSERAENERRLAKENAEKVRKIKKLSDIENEIEERRERINNILKGKMKDDWFGFDAGKITMTDAAVSVVEEQPLKKASVKLSENDLMDSIDVALLAAQKDIDRLEERLKDFARVKNVYDTKELESRKEKCTPCSSTGFIDCARCKGSGTIVANAREACPICGDGERKGYVKRRAKCDRCGGTGQITTRCKKCGGRGKVWVSHGSARFDTKETCGDCGGSGKSYPQSCPNCSGYNGEVEVWQPCNRCHGTGEVSRSNGEPCPNCAGKGKYKCDRCGGRGFTYRPKYSPSKD